MAIQSAYNDTSIQKTQDIQASTSVQKAQEAEQEEKTTTTASEEAASSTAAVYEKTNSTVYAPSDYSKVDLMLQQSNLKAANFQKLIESLVNKQATSNYQAFPQDINSFSGSLKDYISNIKVDDATRLQAQRDIADDGYYGVEQTSNRIMDFATAIAGDDPEKIAEMREAVEKGFQQAEKIWGGQLPEISQKTYDRVMSAFDEWENQVSQPAESSSNSDVTTETQSVAAVTSKR